VSVLPNMSTLWPKSSASLTVSLVVALRSFNIRAEWHQGGNVTGFTSAATRRQKDRPTNRTVLNMLQIALDCLKHMLKASPPQPIISGRCQERYMACFFVAPLPRRSPPGSRSSGRRILRGNDREATHRADATIDSHRSNRIIPGWQSRMSFDAKAANLL
jgi:hypothetical protein